MRSVLSLAMLLTAPAAWAQSANPTAQEANDFVKKVEEELAQIAPSENRIFWINQTYLTGDTDFIAAQTGAEATARSVRLALDAAKFKNLQDLPIDTRRKLTMLRGGITLPAPTRAGAAEELSRISTSLQSMYSTGKGTLNGQPIKGDAIEAEMGTNRDPDRLKEMWTSWHDNVGAPMRQDYGRMVAIANEGANELGHDDVGAMWRSQYDMPAADFSALEDRLWNEVKPLYDELHCYTRTRLNEKYGDTVQSKTGPIRADLLGNMWAQNWAPIYDIVAPEDEGDIGFDLTKLLKAKGYDALKMAKTGEGFFSSLGFDPLPGTFWSRSKLVRPADRDVVCHPSAWNIDNKDDVRIKMCMKVSASDFSVIHHELGHNYYQRAYQGQTYLYQGGANDGFHEAIGDTIALSVTPDYLVKIGLLDEANVPGEDKDIGLLLAKALDRIAYLPFAVLVDKWRWGVFNDSIKDRKSVV